MKFLIDMNLSPDWVPFFADRQIEAAHWTGIGETDASDNEILAFAATNSWVVFTHDLDARALLALWKTKSPSVLQVRAQDVLPAAIGEIVLRAIDAARSNLETGALVTVDSDRHLVRLLPIE
jgi:predicted nuclease of predicted toxin-antitoxin system